MATTKNPNSRYDLINAFMHYSDFQGIPIISNTPIVRKDQTGKFYLDCTPVVNGQNRFEKTYGLEQAKNLKKLTFDQGYTRRTGFLGLGKHLNILGNEIAENEKANDTFGAAAYFLISTEPDSLPDFSFTSTEIRDYANHIVAMFPAIRNLLGKAKNTDEETYNVHTAIHALSTKTDIESNQKQQYINASLDQLVSFIRANINIAVSAHIYEKSRKSPGLTHSQVIQATKNAQLATELIIANYLEYIDDGLAKLGSKTNGDAKKKSRKLIEVLAGQNSQIISKDIIASLFEDAAKNPSTPPVHKGKTHDHNSKKVSDISEKAANLGDSYSAEMSFGGENGLAREAMELAKNHISNYIKSNPNSTGSLADRENEVKMFNDIRISLSKDDTLTDNAKSLIFVYAYCSYFNITPNNQNVSLAGFVVDQYNATKKLNGTGFIGSSIKTESPETVAQYEVLRRLIENDETGTYINDLDNAKNVEENPIGFKIKEQRTNEDPALTR